MKSVIKSVLEGDWTGLQDHFEKMAADKVMRRIEDRKIDVLAKINGVDRSQVEDMINVSD